MWWQVALLGLKSLLSQRQVLALLAGFGLLLVLLGAGTRWWEGRTEQRRQALQLATQRNWLVDSMRHTSAAERQALRRQKDSLLTVIYNRQGAAGEVLHKQHEQVQKRYDADRVLLPAW